MPTPAIQTLINDAQQVLNLDSISAVRSVVAVSLANANTGTPLNPNLTTQQLWNEFYQVVPRSKSDIESIIANQLMKFLYSPPAPGGVGANGQVIFNNNGVLAGDNELFYNPTTNTLTTEKLIVPGNTQVAGSASNLYVGSILNPTLFANTNTKLVGIGTATPGTACDVASGTVRVKNAVGDTSGLLIYQDTGDASKIFNYYNGSMQFGINNTTAMTLNATGLGVGTAPTTKLDVLGSGDGELRLRAGSDAALIFSETAANKNWKIKPSGGDLFFQYSATAYNSGYSLLMSLTAAGNLGIGVAPSAWGSGFRYVQAGPGCAYGTNGSVDRTDVAANWYYNGGDKYINATGKASVFQQSGGAFFWLSTNTASGGAGSAMTLNTNMTLDASGNLLVGTPTNTNLSRIFSRGTATSSALALQGASGDVALAQLTVGKFDNNTTTSQIFVRFTINDNTSGSGQINANGASQAAFGTFSDSRLKENIVSLPSQLANILSLRPVEFDYKDGSGHQIGFVAQEMQEVYSDAVGEQNGFLTVTGWSKTEARLVSAIKELAAKVQALEAKLA